MNARKNEIFELNNLIYKCHIEKSGIEEVMRCFKIKICRRCNKLDKNMDRCTVLSIINNYTKLNTIC